MAKFFPPLEMIDDAPQSERIVLRALAKALSDDYYVYHSVSFIEKQQFLKEGEADLVIFHRKYGLLVLEVKGGGISIENGQWFSQNNFGKTRLKILLIKQEKPNTLFKKKQSAYVSIGYGVCFPNSTLPPAVSLPMDVVFSHFKNDGF